MYKLYDSFYMCCDFNLVKISQPTLKFSILNGNKNKNYNISAACLVII